MRTYENTIVLKPQLSETDISKFIEKTKEFIKKHNGEIVSEEQLGRKKLAYEIKDIYDGFFLYIKFKSDAAFPAQLTNYLKLEEEVIRAMVVKGVEIKKKPLKKTDKKTEG